MKDIIIAMLITAKFESSGNFQMYQFGSSGAFWHLGSP